MLRIVYNENEVIAVMKNDPSTGITYTIERVIICTLEEALEFFKNYPEVELDKIKEFAISL